MTGSPLADIEAVYSSEAERQARMADTLGALVRLVAEYELDDDCELPERIEGILPAVGLAMLYGPSGCCKTFLALSMSLTCANSPMSWFGYHVPQHRPSVYVVGEGWPGIGIRRSAWKSYYHVSDMVSCFFRPEPLNLTDDLQVTAFIDQVMNPEGVLEGIPPGLIVADPLAACIGGESDNEAAVMTHAAASGHRITRATGALVLLVHHTGHDQRRPRGHTALVASCDLVMKLAADGPDHLMLTCDKSRDFPPFEPIAFRLQQHGQSAVLVERDGATDTQKFGAKHRELLAVLRDLGDQGSATQWQQASTESIQGMSRRTFHRHRGFLLDGDWVCMIGKRYALTPKGLSEVPGATEVPQGANGTGQLVPQVPHPFRGGPGTDTEPGTSDADPEFERGDAWEAPEGNSAP